MSQGYQEKLGKTNAAALVKSRRERDVALSYPGPGNKRRRKRCARDLRLFCEEYFGSVFYHPWSADHLRVIARMQECVLRGGLFGIGMPRGAGKTQLAEKAVLWALLYGHRKFVVVVGATEALAEKMLRRIRHELQYNDELAKDHRQVCHAIRALEGNGRKAIGQLFKGQPTRIDWGARSLSLPVVPDSACDGPNVGGSAVVALALTGALRGLSHCLPTGEVVRPDLLVLDDAQTRESAHSPQQTADRLAILKGDLMGLAGPGAQVTAFALLTVICRDDLADQILDRERSPAWQGERTQSIYRWPSNRELWETYHRLRKEGQKRGDGAEEATRFYANNRAEMDEGAEAAWPARFRDDELSAVQHLENLRADLGEEAFAAEHQNSPARPASAADDLLTADEIARRLNGVPRGIVPRQSTILTAFVDVQDRLLFYCVAAWSANFTGAVVDYGTWPRQRSKVFTLRKASPTLYDLCPGASREAAVLAALGVLAEQLVGKEWSREDGTRMRLDRVLIDAGWLQDVVYSFCQRSPFAATLLPSRGVGLGATKRPMSEFDPKPGEKYGWNWLVAPTSTRSGRCARFDSNHYKSFIHSRLALAVGDEGSLSLFGRDPEEHALFAQHLVAEFPTRVSALGRTVDEWARRPGGPENHWLDTVVGCAVGASMMGAAVPGRNATPDRPPPREKVSYRAQWEAARAKQGRR